MAQDISQGFYSVLRWREDVTRDEARNVAVILVDKEGSAGGIKAAPLSAVSSRLRDQGLLDDLLVKIQNMFEASKKFRLEELEKLYGTLQESLCLTPPKPVALLDQDAVLNALYRAYVAPRVRGSRPFTKGVVLDRVVREFRNLGHDVRRSQYYKDFIFDCIVKAPAFSVGEVLSFGTGAKNWSPVEHDAGHFLYAVDRLQSSGFEVGEPFAVIQPPRDKTQSGAVRSHRRVSGWMKEAQVTVVNPDHVRKFAETQLSMNV